MDFDIKKDYYKLLWVDENASDDDIKKAFRKLAMKYHPDKWWDQEKFKEINEANQVIWDPQKRKQYDAYRKWGFGWFDFWWFQNWGFQGWFDVWDIFDMFGDVFGWWAWGWRRSRKDPSRGDDLVVNLTISFEESYKWVNKEISYARHVTCNDCWWKWVDKDSQKNVCSVCQWRWVVANVQRTPFWAMQIQTTCNACKWEGYSDSKPCKSCNWIWLHKKDEKIKITIPSGINNWDHMKVPWMWNYWRYWWEAWDLYVKILISWSSKFKRSWNDMLVEVEINLFQAVLWGEISIDHPDGKINVKIPKWLQVNQSIRVGWKGFGKWGIMGNKWDLVVQPKIIIPKKLSKDEEKLWKELNNLNK